PLVTGVSLSTNVRNNFDGWVEFELTVGSTPLVVSDLGRWVRSGNSGTHTVKLVGANGLDIPGAAVTVSTAGATAGEFKYVALTNAITLASDTSYYLVSQEVSGGDTWYEWDSTLTSSGAATINNPIYAPNGSSSFGQVGGSNNSYVPVSLRYSADASWTLVGETHYIYDGMTP